MTQRQVDFAGAARPTHAAVDLRGQQGRAGENHGAPASALGHRGIVEVAIDPGRVRTRMGGPDADLSVDESIGAITATIDRLARADSGRFLSRHGQDVPW